MIFLPKNCSFLTVVRNKKLNTTEKYQQTNTLDETLKLFGTVGRTFFFQQTSLPLPACFNVAHQCVQQICFYTRSSCILCLFAAFEVQSAQKFYLCMSICSSLTALHWPFKKALRVAHNEVPANNAFCIGSIAYFFTLALTTALFYYFPPYFIWEKNHRLNGNVNVFDRCLPIAFTFVKPICANCIHLRKTLKHPSGHVEWF